MNFSIVNEIRKGAYIDSVALMQISRQLKELEGVEEAGLMMGTSANLQIMSDAGVLTDIGKTAEPNDLVIAIRASNQSFAETALNKAVGLLDAPRIRENGQSWRPKSIRAAVSEIPEANLAIVSVAGEYAAAEARKALRKNLNVMIFSDNVSIEEEVSLKHEARDSGLLVMGPDCGTAIIRGVPLAFANRVSEGDIGIIGASGTGIQEVSCLISRLGKGISHAIGVGGRDLSQQVGGLSTLTAIDLLDEDPGTSHVVLISKPPAKEVVVRIFDRISESPKSYTICLLGSENLVTPENSRFASTLKSASEHATGNKLSGHEPIASGEIELSKSSGNSRREKTGSTIRGLFAGGTLCAEAQIVLLSNREPVLSNVPIPGSGSPEGGIGHLLLDLGADEFTRGKPHPMIDPHIRDDYLKQALEDPAVGAVVVDVVLGYGSHENPAAVLADALVEHDIDQTPIVASVCGTDQDIQVRQAQVSLLEGVGISVADSNADAILKALSIVRKSDG